MIQLPLDMNEYPCSQIRTLFGTLVKCRLKSKRTVVDFDEREREV